MQRFKQQELHRYRGLRASIASRRTITRAEGFQGDLPTGQHGQLIPMGAMPGMYAGGAGTMGAGADYWSQYYNAQQKARGGPDTGLKGMAGGFAPSPDAAKGFDAIKKAVEGAGAAVAQTLDEMSKFNSLAELFGQTTSGIPVEVYSDMAAALSEAGMAQEDINAALDDYEHAAGLATDASDLYGQYVDTLAEKHTSGKVKIEDFTAAMLAMSNASPAVYEAMGKIGEGIKSFVSDPLGAIGGLFKGKGGPGDQGKGKVGGAEGEDEATAYMDRILAKSAEIDTLFTSRPSAWNASVTSFQELASTDVETFATNSVLALETIGSSISALDGKTINIQMVINAITGEGIIPSSLPVGGPDATRGTGTGSSNPSLERPYQHGGWLEGGKIGRVTEDNAPEMFAVGGRQYVMAPRGGGTVIPMREITPAALAGGGGGGEQSSHVYLDGKELQHSWVRHRVMQNRAT